MKEQDHTSRETGESPEQQGAFPGFPVERFPWPPVPRCIVWVKFADKRESRGARSRVAWASALPR